MPALAASVTPQSSSTVTTARRARPGVKSFALVWKYSSMLPCRSRWSWVRLVKPATSNTTPSTRWKETACEETSIEAASRPRSRISASRAWTSVDSGVVRRLGIGAPPARISMVPIRPVFCPRACSRALMKYVVVVLPLVPVTPKRAGACAPSGPALVDQGGQPAHEAAGFLGQEHRNGNVVRERQQARAGVVRQHGGRSGLHGLGDEVGPVPARARAGRRTGRRAVRRGNSGRSR